MRNNPRIYSHFTSNIKRNKTKREKKDYYKTDLYFSFSSIYTIIYVYKNK